MLRRKQEEVSLLRRGYRDRLSRRAAGRPGRGRVGLGLDSAWQRVQRWLQRTLAARSLLGELEATLERALLERERVRRHLATEPDRDTADDLREHLLYLQQTVSDAQHQIVQIEVSALRLVRGATILSLIAILTSRRRRARRARCRPWWRRWKEVTLVGTS